MAFPGFVVPCHLAGCTSKTWHSRKAHGHDKSKQRKKQFPYL